MVDKLEEVSETPQAPLLNRPFFHTIKSGERALETQLFWTLDAAQMQELDVDHLLESIACKHLLMDLTNLSFVDSTGLIRLLKLRKLATSSGHTS